MDDFESGPDGMPSTPFIQMRAELFKSIHSDHIIIRSENHGILPSDLPVGLAIGLAANFTSSLQKIVMHWSEHYNIDPADFMAEVMETVKLKEEMSESQNKKKKKAKRKKRNQINRFKDKYGPEDLLGENS